MPTQSFIEEQERARREAAEQARQVAYQQELDDLIAHPRLLTRADAIEAEIATLEKAAAKATESFGDLEHQMEKATVSGDEKELARLEGLFGARKRLRDHAVAALDDACVRHEMVRSAARIFRGREQCAREYPALAAGGERVRAKLDCLTAHISDFRDSLGDCVMDLAAEIDVSNVASAAFDRRAESCGYRERCGKLELQRLLATVVTALRDLNWQHSGEHLVLSINNTISGVMLNIQFNKKMEVRL
jgi:hypothetical protein